MLRDAAKYSATWNATQRYDEIYDYFNYHIRDVVTKYQDMFGGDGLGACVAYLHDVVEDTGCEIYMVRSNFGDEVADAVNAITKRKGETKTQYIARCKLNDTARKVKVCDSIFNMEHSIKKGEFERAAMYAKQIERLMK